MKSFKRHIFCAILFLLCTNFGEQKSTRREKPDVNISGIVTSQAGEKMDAKNISIAGKYEQIRVYKMPANKSANPKQYEATLDLDELTEINISPIKDALFTYQPEEKNEKKTNEKAKKTVSKPEEYIKIEAVYKNGEKRIYLIERKKKFWFDEVIGETPGEQRPNIEAIKQIIIEKVSSKSNEEQNEKNIPDQIKKKIITTKNSAQLKK